MAAPRIMEEIARVPSAGLPGLLGWWYDSKLSCFALPAYLSNPIHLKHQGAAKTRSKG